MKKIPTSSTGPATTLAEDGQRPLLVAHMTTVHPPLDSRIFVRQCRTLAAAGYRVELWVPHYREEVVEGVRIVPLPPPASRLERMTRTQVTLLCRALGRRADLYHLHDPELIPLGLVLRAFGRHVVYDAHEDLPRDLLSKHWIPRRLRRPVSRVAEAAEAVASRLLTGVIAATPVIGRRFPARRSAVVNNFPPTGEISPELGPPLGERKPLVLYTGDLAEIRGTRQMVEAIAQVPGALGARLLVLGRFTSEPLRLEVERLPGWEHVEFRGWCGWEEVRGALGAAQIGLVLYYPEPNYVEAQPRKLFEYMAAGLPVIVSDFPYWRSIVEETGCGLTVDPFEPGQAADAISWLLAHPSEAAAMGHRGRQAALKRYCWRAEATKLLAFYDRLLGGRGGDRTTTPDPSREDAGRAETQSSDP